MFVVWGSKIRREHRGYCANYCGACQAIRAFSLTDLYKVSHLYYIPLGGGDLTATELKCHSCNSPMYLKPNHSIPLRGSPTDMDGMLDDVPLDVLESWNKQLEEDCAAREAPESLTPEARNKRLVEAFVAQEPRLATALQAGPKVDAHLLKPLLAWGAVWVFVFTLGKWIAGTRWFEDATFRSGVDAVGIGMMIIFATFFMMLGWIFISYRFRIMKTEIYPALAICLAPLAPTQAELTHVRKLLKKSRLKVGMFSVEKLEAAINRAR